jgi:hypothetical protein
MEEEATAVIAELERPMKEQALSVALYEGARSVYKAIGLSREAFSQMTARSLGEWEDRPQAKKGQTPWGETVVARAKSQGVPYHPNAVMTLPGIAHRMGVAKAQQEAILPLRDVLVGELYTLHGLKRQELAEIINRNPSRVSHILKRYFTSQAPVGAVRGLIPDVAAGPHGLHLTDEEWELLAREDLRLDAQRSPDGGAIMSLSPATEARVVTVERAERLMHFVEAAMVRDYEAFVGRSLTRRRYRIKATGESLVSDLFDDERAELIEAKSLANRMSVRLALGQLLDYRRHHANWSSLAVLLPELPNADLCALLGEHDVTVIFRCGEGFDRLEPPHRAEGGADD